MGFLHGGLHPKQSRKFLSSFCKFAPQSFNDTYQRAENVCQKDETLTTCSDNLEWEKYENEDESTRTPEQEESTGTPEEEDELNS